MTLLEKISSRGYFEFIVRPSIYKKDLLNYNRLLEYLEKAQIGTRGWDFPYVDRGLIKRNAEYIDQEFDYQHHLEYFKFAQSGQFYGRVGFWEDWRDQSGFWPVDDETWEPNRILRVNEAVFAITEYLIFGSRLFESIEPVEQIYFEINFKNLPKRRLAASPAQMPIFDKVSDIPEFSLKRTITKSELQVRHKDLSLELAKDLFSRFGWDVDIQLLRGIQIEVFS